MAAAMLRAFSERIAAREDARGRELHEWTDLPIKDGEAYCIDTHEGRLIRVPSEGTWILFMSWTGHEARVLTRGKRSHVERYAQEVLSYGPPGGPAYQGEALAWKKIGDDATLHAVTVGGEFRLMPLRDSGHLLLFARNDYTVLVLAMGQRDALMRDAEEHLLDFRGDGLRVRRGDEKVDLHGLGAGSVVAYLELFHEERLVLGHLGGDTFGLFHTRGTEHICMRVCSLADLRRGDLGCSLGWTFSEIQAEPAATIGAVPPEPSRSMPSPAKALPTDVGPSPRRLHRVERLGDAELEMLQRHLACTEASGAGATIVPRIFEGLRVLIELGESNRLLRASELRSLLAVRARVRFHCCSKTLARSLVAVATRTPLLRREGRRWRLRLGDLLLHESELLASIRAESRPRHHEEAATPGSSKTDTTSPNHHSPGAPAREAPAPVEARATGIGIGQEGEELAPNPAPRAHQRSTITAGQPFLWSSRGSRLPDEEAASRWPGRKPRGPPGG